VDRTDEEPRHGLLGHLEYLDRHVSSLQVGALL
jgi:hypothetical protein